MSNPTELCITPSLGVGLLSALPWWLPGLALGFTGHRVLWLAAAVLVTCGLAACWRYGTHLNRRRVTRIRQDTDGLQIHTADGFCKRAHLHPSSRLGASWLWLRLETDTRQYSLLLSDRPCFRNTDRDALRRFRTRLRLTHTGPITDTR